MKSAHQKSSLLKGSCIKKSYFGAWTSFSHPRMCVIYFNYYNFYFHTCNVRNDAFENPVIQQHFRNLEALALDMVAPEDIEDLISKMQT